MRTRMQYLKEMYRKTNDQIMRAELKVETLYARKDFYALEIKKETERVLSQTQDG